MIQTYRVPANAARATLIDLHNEILALNPDIRVVSRWGRFTEYDVKLKKREAAAIIDDEAPENVWRLVFGADHEEHPVAFSVDVQFYDAEKRYWDTTFLDIGDPAAVVDRAIAWLREKHPAAEALVEIDNRLLSDGLEPRQFVAHVRQLVVDSGRSQRQIALELDMNPSLFGRAIDPDNERPSLEVTARIAGALGETWEEERVWRRVEK